MSLYFWVAKNRSGSMKSGVVSSENAAKAYLQASQAATTFSDDVFVVVKLERIE